MGIRFQEVVEQAMLDKAPALHRNLKQRGKLDEYMVDLADQISSALSEGVMQIRREQKLDDLPPMQLVQELNNARAQVEEEVLAAYLEFPSDDPSTPSPAATGGQATPT